MAPGRAASTLARMAALQHQLRPVDVGFLDAAPFVARAELHVEQPAERVWAVVGSERMWAWARPAIRDLRYTTPEPHGQGATRELTLAGFLRLEEVFHRWEEGHRATFHVSRASHRLFDALSEDFLVEPRGPSACRLTWTMAAEPRGPIGAAAWRRISKAAGPGNALALRGIRKEAAKPA